MKRAKIVTVANRKGGVGKSFTAIQLAINSAIGGPDRKNKKLKVLIIDADSQQNTSLYFLKYLGAKTFHQKTMLPVNPNCPNNEVYNITDVFLGHDFVEYPTQCENLFIIPSDGNIDNFREEFNNYPDKKITDSLVQLFNDFIKLVENEYDLIVIDTPPSKTYACQGALAVTDYVIIPTVLDTFTVSQSVPNLIGDIEKINSEYRSEENPIKIAGILPNRLSSIKPNNYEKQNLSELSEKYGKYLHSGFYFVERVAFKIHDLPQDINDFEYMKDKKTADQMRGFYNVACEQILNEIYKDKECS